MEKVRLVFLFSIKLSHEFVEKLQDKNCVVELNDERKMTYFRSPEGDCVLLSAQDRNPNTRKFKGKPIKQQKKRAVKTARRSKNVRNPKRAPIPQVIPNPTVVDDVEMGDEEDEAEVLEQIRGDDQKRAKIEDFLEEMEEEPEEWALEETTKMPWRTVSMLRLAEQIEALAFNINLEDCFQEKALRAVRLFEANDQFVSMQDFNQLFKFFLKDLKSGRLQNPTGSSMKLIRLFEHFKRSFIRPIGEEWMADTLRIIDDEIRMLGGSKDHEIPLKIVQNKIDGFMSLINCSWANLDH
ncbi:unnamed protein product [Caenorhabditis nigoni]